jgi:alpha-ketoglutarate-dependent taurine dioxygenase
MSALHVSNDSIQEYKEVLRQQGYVNFVEIPDDFNHLELVQQFGDLMPQYDGELVWSIKADPRFADVYHSLNNKPLLPHTECYEFPGLPPKYLALWCIKAPEDRGGQTTLADGYAFLNSLTAKERDKLSSHRYEFHSTAGLQKSNLGGTARHPIYDLSAEEPIFRYSFACLNVEDNPFIKDIRQRVLDFFEQEQKPIYYQKNSLLIWDNWRMLHARTGFTDQTRHLKRVWLLKSRGQ